MLEIVLNPKILPPPKSGALGLSIFSPMVNPRLPKPLRYFRVLAWFAFNSQPW